MADQIEAARTEPSEIIRPTSPGARFAAGTVAGVIGGILMMGLLMAYANAKGGDLTTPLKEVGAFVYGVEALVMGSKAILAGALIIIGYFAYNGAHVLRFMVR